MFIAKSDTPFSFKWYPSGLSKSEFDYDQPPKPVALLIGTSNISGINEEKLSPDVEVAKHISYTLQECRDYILSCNPHTPPDVVVLHSLTNDLKT
jgi:hypothetical protein